MNKERKFLISADSSGVLLGTPRVWQEVWGQVRQHPRFGGVEMIGWGNGLFHLWTDRLLTQARKDGWGVVGIHGRIGSVETEDIIRSKIVLWAADKILLMSTTRLIKSYADKVDYILIHASEFRSRRNREVFWANRDEIGFVFVENNAQPGAVGESLEAVRHLNRWGIKAGVMFDLFHYMYSFEGTWVSLEAAWHDTLKEVEWVLKQKHNDCSPVVVGLHIPIGTNIRDSLPVERMTLDMWKRLADITVRGCIDCVVLENQQAGVDLLWLSSWARTRQRDRNHKIVDALTEAGVL